LLDGAAVGTSLLFFYQADSVPTLTSSAGCSGLVPHGFDFMGNLPKRAIRIGCTQVSSHSSIPNAMH
jgi:hypothetical protein